MIVSEQEQDRRIALVALALGMYELEVRALVSWITHDHPRPRWISERIAARIDAGAVVERGPVSS